MEKRGAQSDIKDRDCEIVLVVDYRGEAGRGAGARVCWMIECGDGWGG